MRCPPISQPAESRRYRPYSRMSWRLRSAVNSSAVMSNHECRGR